MPTKIIKPMAGNFKKTAITYFSGTETINMSFGEFNDIVNNIKNSLLKFGIKKGDRVLLLSENHAKWLPVFIGITNYGAIVVPVDAQSSNDRILNILNDSKPKLIIVSKLFEEKMEINFSKISFPVVITNFYGDLLLAKGDVVSEEKMEEPPTSDDIAMIIYTSGTSGTPKGIILTHGAIVSAITHTTVIGEIKKDDSMLSVLPFSHVFGLINAALVPYYLGCRIVIAPTLNPLELLSIISYHKITYLCFVPRLAEVFLMLLKSAGTKFKKLTIVIGGASCPVSVLNGLRSFGIRVALGYGMTECSGGIIINFTDKVNSCGKALSPIYVKLKNPVNGVGELLINSPSNTVGVWNNPELSEKIFEDGYLKTGDMAKIDEDGYVSILGRIKEVIVTSGGMNIYPDELEERLAYIMPFAKEFGVIGLKERSGEIPVLVVLPNLEKIQEDVKDVAKYIEDEVKKLTDTWPEWEKFRKIILISEALPRTNSFKVLRRKLVDLVKNLELKDKKLEKRTEDNNDEIIKIFNRFKPFIAKHINIEEKEMEVNKPLSRFDRLDSLGKLSLLAFFEHNLSLEIGEVEKSDFDTFYSLIKFLLKTNPPEKLLKADAEALVQELPIPVPLDYSHEGIKRRQEFLEEKTGANLEELKKLDYSYSEKLKGNIENIFGFSQLPLGIVGPILVNGDYASGEFFVPMATTEGALIASVTRGAQAITLSGGASCKIVADSISRTPIFLFASIDEMFEFSKWMNENFDSIKEVAESSTRFGKLLKIDQYPLGTNMGLRFSYYTGDASGQNMVTIATQKAINYIKNEYDGFISDYFLECNLSGDKKANSINFTQNRGKKVIAHTVIGDEIVKNYLKSNSDRIVKLYELSILGAVQSHSFGSQAHYSNPLTAIYIACGQDPACAAESAVGITNFKKVDGGLSVSVTLPDLMIGTVGGGTSLPIQKSCLEIMGCLGGGKARKMAEIVAATVLAAEISITASMAAGDFAYAHETYGR